MKKIYLFFALLCLIGTALSAQCVGFSNSCPEDQVFNLKSGITDTAVVANHPDVTGCESSRIFYTINGPVGKAAAGLPNSFRFPLGDSRISYAYTDMRFGSFSDTAIILPDNTIDTFLIPLRVADLGSETTVGQAGGLTRVCLVMEHSYLGDLDMYITCPDGSKAALHFYNPNDEVQRQLLGQGNDFTTTPDPGALYCWTMSAEKTMAEYVSDSNLGANVMMPTIDYAPEEDLALFDNCLIDGNWTLHIKDNLSNDNGSISSAFIDFGDVSTVCAQTIAVTTRTTGLFDRSPSATFSLNAFPNPAMDVFRLSVDARRSGSAHLEVFSVDGKQLHSRAVDLLVGENIYPVNTSGWHTGVYSVRVVSGGAEQWVRVVKGG